MYNNQTLYPRPSVAELCAHISLAAALTGLILIIALHSAQRQTRTVVLADLEQAGNIIVSVLSKQVRVADEIEVEDNTLLLKTRGTTTRIALHRGTIVMQNDNVLSPLSPENIVIDKLSFMLLGNTNSFALAFDIANIPPGTSVAFAKATLAFHMTLGPSPAPPTQLSLTPNGSNFR